jgi:hypothetical protein
LAHCAIPECLRGTTQIPVDISVEEYSSAIKKWKESTSTSPSGRHLGYYKATLKMKNVTSDICNSLNVVIRCGLIPS